MAVKKKGDRSLFGGGGKVSEEESARRLRAEDQGLAKEVDEIEKEMDELRAVYELFFMGVEKLEPLAQRDLLKSRLRRFQEQKPRNTALKFRVQQLKARMVSLENYWVRTNRQREAGSYHRDIARMKRREAERLRREAEQHAGDGAVAPSRTLAPASPSLAERPEAGARPQGLGERPARRPGPAEAAAAPSPSSGAPAPAAGPRPSASSAADLTDAKLQKLYDTYLGARRRCGESTDLRFEDMATALRSQVPRLITKTGARSIEFKVVIRGGKAVLKALPRT